MGDMLVVASKIKEAIKGHGLNTAGDAAEGLNAVVVSLVEKACARAKSNGRKTVRPEDF